MVMATPSPQQVGREFVRQYYTVLHEAPQVLHRFYSSGSTFVHGGVDRPGLSVEEPVVGQLEIDKKIKQLNFKDCHTKIRQVDSQATIGNGVVVQVTGELSNSGEPMRRFMQTFVLAPQTPKKYYVHNDIFRYQDEVYQDNSDSESEEGNSHHQQVESNSTASSTSTVPTTATQKTSNYYHNEHQNDHTDLINQTTSSLAQNNNENQAHLNENKEHGSIVNGHTHSSESKEQKLGDNINEITQHISNLEFKNNDSNQATSSVKSLIDQSSTVKESKDEPVSNNKQENSDGKNSWAQIINRGGDSITATPSQNQQFNQQFSSGSSMLSKVGGSGVSSTFKENNFQQATSNSQSKSFQNGNQMNNLNTNPTTSSRNQNSKVKGGPSSSSQKGGVSSSTAIATVNNNNNFGSNQNNNVSNAGGNTSDLDDDKRFGRYSDSQQVFVGNLSQDLSEIELKQFFNQFGKVLEVRINSNTKQQSGRRLPNYGFVVFEDKQIVDALLGSSKSNNLTYKNEKGVEFRLNVEEKRARQGRMPSSFGSNISKSNRATRSTSNGSQSGNSNKKNVNNDSNFVGDKNNAFVDVNHRNKNNFRRS